MNAEMSEREGDGDSRSVAVADADTASSLSGDRLCDRIAMLLASASFHLFATVVGQRWIALHDRVHVLVKVFGRKVACPQLDHI